MPARDTYISYIVSARLSSSVFQFKQFSVRNTTSAMRVGTDGVLLGAWADAGAPGRVLDVGCGTGVIALMMMQRYGACHVDAIDIDSPSVEEARYNFASSPWSGRGTVILCDMAGYEPDCLYDMVISNPPFFTEETRSPDARRAEARHGSSLTPQGLLQYAARLVTDGGRLAFIAPYDSSDDLTLSLTLHGWCALHVTDVVTKEGLRPSRRLWLLTRRTSQPVAVQYDTLTIRNADGSYSDSYRMLVDPFYIK